jgi:hypothetical protein
MNAEEQKAHLLDKQNQLQISNIVYDVISYFSKDICHLISSYSIIPSSYHFSLSSQKGSALQPRIYFFKHPICGDLCVISNTSSSLYVFASDWSLKETMESENRFFVGMALWRYHLFIIDFADHCIFSCDIQDPDFSTWRLTYLFGSEGFGNYQFSYPDDIQVVNDCCLIADFDNDRIQSFTLSEDNKKCVFTFNTSIHMLSPTSIAINDIADDQLFVQNAVGDIHLITDSKDKGLLRKNDRPSAIYRNHAVVAGILYLPNNNGILSIDTKTGKLLKQKVNISGFIQTSDSNVVTHLVVRNRYLYISQNYTVIVIHLDEFVFLE